MNWIKELFSDDQGVLSSIRVMSFEIVNVALFIAVFSVWTGRLTLDVTGLTLGLLGVGITGKIIQRSTSEVPKEMAVDSPDAIGFELTGSKDDD